MRASGRCTRWRALRNICSAPSIASHRSSRGAEFHRHDPRERFHQPGCIHRVKPAPRRRVIKLLLLAIVASGTFVTPRLAAQETITSEFSCPGCTLSITKVADLGRTGESLITPTSTACKGVNGHLFVSGLIALAEISVYDESGMHIRTFGRSGSGPGEFLHIRSTVCGVDGKLRVFDAGNARISILSEDGSLESSHPLEIGFLEGAVPMSGGWTAVNTTIRSDGAVGHPIHIVAPAGEIQQSMGRTGSGPYTRDVVKDKRILASAGEQHLWAAHMNRYRIDLWSTDGSLLKTIERSGTWFEPWEGIDPGEPFFARPKPRILSMFEDSTGNLWTSLLVPSDDWEPSPRGSSLFGPGGPTVAALEPKWDSVIEVIDLESGRLRYAARLQGLAFQFIGSGLAYRPREAPDGTHYLQVVRMRLVNP